MSTNQRQDGPPGAHVSRSMCHAAQPNRKWKTAGRLAATKGQQHERERRPCVSRTIFGLPARCWHSDFWESVVHDCDGIARSTSCSTRTPSGSSVQPQRGSTSKRTRCAGAGRITCTFSRRNHHLSISTGSAAPACSPRNVTTESSSRAPSTMPVHVSNVAPPAS